MKKIFYLFLIMASTCSTICANNSNDTLSISDIMQAIESAMPVEVNDAAWNGDWSVAEWQQIEYMPREEIYQTSYIKDALLTMNVSNGKGTMRFEGYTFSISDATTSVITINGQEVDNAYGEKDHASGLLVLNNSKLYLHLRIIGSQDYAVDMYGEGVKINKEDIELVIDAQRWSSKILRNNQILIRRGEDTYTLTGQKVE